MSDVAPSLTPPTITAGRQQAVVVEFNRDFPKNVLVTLDFYDETLSKKIGIVPTNPLGPRTVKANFPEFAQPGVVYVGVQLARSDSPLFPKFHIRVRSPLESILDVVPHTHASASSSTALLAAVVAYLGHCDDKELEELDMKMDGTLVNILRSALPHVADWKLSYDMKKVAQTLERLQAELKRAAIKSSASHTPEIKMVEGRVANGYGAACVQPVGGVPTERSSELLHQYLPNATLRTDGELSIDSTSASLVGFFRSIKSDADTAANFHERIDRRNLEAFVAALDGCQGQLLLSGIGKSGHVAQRFASSLSSVSISASFVHAAEWIHGDLGRAQAGRDMAVFLSHSGATKECVVAAARLGERGVATMAITAGKDSPLSKLCMSTLCYDGKGLQEPFGLLPTTSLVLQDLVCNGLLCELIRRKGIAQATFASNHPGGNIGATLRNRVSGIESSVE